MADLSVTLATLLIRPSIAQEETKRVRWGQLSRSGCPRTANAEGRQCYSGPGGVATSRVTKLWEEGFSRRNGFKTPRLLQPMSYWGWMACWEMLLLSRLR